MVYPRDAREDGWEDGHRVRAAMPAPPPPQKAYEQPAYKSPPPYAPPKDAPMTAPPLASMPLPVVVTITETLTICVNSTSLPFPRSLLRVGDAIAESPLTSTMPSMLAATPVLPPRPGAASPTTPGAGAAAFTSRPVPTNKVPPADSHVITTVGKVAIIMGALFSLGVMFGILWSVCRRRPSRRSVRESLRPLVPPPSHTFPTRRDSNPGPGPQISRGAVTQSQLMDEMMTAAYAVDEGMWYDGHDGPDPSLYPGDEKGHFNKHQSVYSYASSRVSAMSATPSIAPLQGPPRHLQHQQDDSLLRPRVGLPTSPRRVPPFSPRQPLLFSPRRPPSSMYASTLASPREEGAGRQSNYFDVLSLYAPKSRMDASSPPPPVPPVVLAPQPLRRVTAVTAGPPPTPSHEGFGNGVIRGPRGQAPLIPPPINDNWTWLMAKVKNVI